MAQAFSSVDTLLAPFVKVDDLSYKEVKQCMQTLIYGLNIPSRWGCVSDRTQIATPNGWKYREELQFGDMIYTWVDGVLHEAPLIHILVKENESGIMHQYKGSSYCQTVTPEHRVVYVKNHGGYRIKQSDELFNRRKTLSLPTYIEDVMISGNNELSDEEVMLAAMYYCDGSNFDSRGKVCIYKSQNRDTGIIKEVLDALNIKYNYRLTKKDRCDLNKIGIYNILKDSRDYVKSLVGSKYKIDERFLHLDREQSALFIKTWASFDGSTHNRLMCQYDNDEIRDALEIIMLRAGYTSHIWSRRSGSNKNKTNYVFVESRKSVNIIEKEIVKYSGTVWCPTTKDGTAIYRDENGNIFISGNSQPPFSNFTLDWTVPNDLAEMNCIVGGKELDFKYKDCKREMDMINKAFIEVMLEGDANGRGFQYPIPTYSITKDFDWDENIPNNKLLFEMTAKYGTPYFSNYVNSNMEPSDIRSMCCRLRLDLKEIRKKSGGGYFGAGDQTGSIAVVTINLPRLAYRSNSEEEFYSELDKLLDICARSLEIKRKVITHYFNEGLYPYTRAYLDNFDNHFSTIGIVGMNEACLNAKWVGKNISTVEGKKFANDVLDYIISKIPTYQEQYGNLFNLEATPAEGVSHRFALHDKEKYPDIIVANNDSDASPYYTNSTHLPVGYTDDIFEALNHQDELQCKYTSGTVFHGFLGEQLPDWKSAMMLTKKITDNYKLPYFTFSPTYSICPDHGYINGEEYECPKCGKSTEVYSRVTGYYRAVQNFNDGKAQEFKDRKEYKFSDGTYDSVVGTVKQDEPVIKDIVDFEISNPLLFTTTTCPNCKIAKQDLTESGVIFETIVADDGTERSLELAKKLNIKQAPTLVIEKDGNVECLTGVSKIREYLESIK